MGDASDYRILIVESHAIIALDLEQTLRDAGYSRVEVATSCTQAESWLATQTPHVAVLDVDLLDGICTDVALTLHERSVPFIVFSGRSDKSAVHPVFSNGSWLAKPAPADIVVSTIAGQLMRDMVI